MGPRAKAGAKDGGMARNWTFGQKMGLGFALTVALAAAGSAVAVLALRGVVSSKDHVITVNGENLLAAERLTTAGARWAAATRGYLLDGKASHLAELKTRRGEFSATFSSLRGRVTSQEELRLLADVEKAELDYLASVDRVVGMKEDAAPLEAIVRVFDEETAPRRQRLAQTLDVFAQEQMRVRDVFRETSTARASFAVALLIAIAIAVVVLSIVVALTLNRALSREIGTAVGNVQSSSSELQAAAQEQATGAKEQSTAMKEIATTMNELLATSRQIAASAQRVASIAAQTADGARTGAGMVQRANDSSAATRRQVDLIVEHMLDLGRKSQQIGAVLDIVAELAEQTNILAINATVEAAGAGESGRRFSVVADEIRKLADRVAGSTKEIRGLIDDVRAAVNTTVMATETGSKAFDLGARQVGEVAFTFKEIAEQVATTTDAAREIELSTKQQATAVEQVNLAIASVTTTTRENETSSGQTLQTAVQLAALSRDLSRLVRAESRA